LDEAFAGIVKQHHGAPTPVMPAGALQHHRVDLEFA
jgi:hypothetical protein